VIIPKIIDNERFKLLDVLKQVSGDFKDLSIATGYWDLKVMLALKDEIEKFDKVRILIGREPQIPRAQVGEPEVDFPAHDIEIDLQNLAPESELREIALKTKEWLQSGKLEVRVYRRTFLHAKTYIFGNFNSQKAVGLIGSSNFTLNGLTTNTELNELESDERVVLFQPQTPEQQASHLSWFESKWNDDLTEPWNEKLISIVQDSPLGDLFFSPYETYIKTLHDLYQEELLDEEELADKAGKGKTLFDFQQKNINALTRRLKKYGVAMLSDSVGLGKTSTSIGVIKRYLDDPDGKKRVEIICPKSIVSQWEKELTEEDVLGYRPITLQNSAEIERKQELDAIASVSLFVIDESHNLRHSGGARFQQLLDWIRSNPKAHVLLVTATPINNSLMDITTQILLGAAGNSEIMKVTTIDENGQTIQITFHQAVENLMKKINQDLKRDNKIDFKHVRRQMTPIIRAFVVRRTRQGIQKEYGSLLIDGKPTTFPIVKPHVDDYEFSVESTKKVSKVSSKDLPLDLIYSIDPESLANAAKVFKHPIRQLEKMQKLGEKDAVQDSAMFYVFQLILMLGFLPYRWRLYETKFYGKTKDQIRELGLPADESKSLLQQVGIFGILRTIFLKRMESSVSALETSLATYSKKLDFFAKGLGEGKIYSITDFAALESSWDDDDEDFSSSELESRVVAAFDPKNFASQELLEDVKSEQELVRVIAEQLKILKQDDSKIRSLVEILKGIEAKKPGSKVLVFSYFSDTVAYLQENLESMTPHITAANIGFVSSNNGSDSERLASRFSPNSKRYTLKGDESELQFLVATDVLSEGQNLQDAGILINYDLHWNPVRMIQRNGRVNRLGTKYKEVSIHNMRPERKLDSYLNLVQRLQGKIDMIRNTIGTDTPVLDEPENAIEYGDAIKDIYDSDELKRIKALEDAEKAADFLLAEDDYVSDLFEFHRSNSLNTEYRDQIYNIPKGKWAIVPEKKDESIESRELFGLVELTLKSAEKAHQFVSIDASDMSTRALSSLQALEILKVDPSVNQRIPDTIKTDRVAIDALISSNASVYMNTAEIGAPVGQERDVLRLLYELGFEPEEINEVRLGFKSNDLFIRKEMDSLKRKIMSAKRNGNEYQSYLSKLLEISSKIKVKGQSESKRSVVSSQTLLVYTKGH
jgi:superfamily II DNA/RNA helicase